MASLREKTEMESQCPSCKIKISKTDASPSTDLETMLSLLQTQCKLCSKKFKIANHVQYINHTQNCSINELQNKPVLVSDIFSISEAHIPRTIEDAALYVLRTKMRSNPKNSTIEFKTGGRVSLGLLIHNTALSNSYLICYKLNSLGFNFVITFLIKNTQKLGNTRCLGLQINTIQITNTTVPSLGTLGIIPKLNIY